MEKRPKGVMNSGRHAAECRICAHPQRDGIEQEFINWRSPASIAKQYKLANRASVYRHAHALELFPKRRRNVRAALEKIIELAGEVKVNAPAVVSAVTAYARLNSRGELILQKEQPNASRERLRDISYVLAVLNVEYQKNRDYLLAALQSCLSRPKESSEDDVCDADLLKFVTNLYWRGDSALVVPLPEIADSRRDVIGQIGMFYADLLDFHAAATINELSKFAQDKQHVICQIVGRDEYSIVSPGSNGRRNAFVPLAVRPRTSAFIWPKRRKMICRGRQQRK